MNNKPWEAIFRKYNIKEHNFDKAPFEISAKMIKTATAHFKNTNEKEVRILCKQDSRESRPNIFKEHNLFILPVKNGLYNIIRGEGYIDIPKIKTATKKYNSSLDFTLDTAQIGSSEMQHLDFAYASSLIRTFLDDPTLVLTIRGRKYTPPFSFKVGKQTIETKSIQTEVDAGYEGKNQVVLIEAKNSKTDNNIIRQLYYPFRQWSSYTNKKVIILFFEKRDNLYLLWHFKFTNKNDYNSIKLVNSAKFEII